ncbi:hypothetical protein GS429_19145 [Natronorubrum sp. JWXQ-INN-674]|uniref:Halobacterial output domain-containing protein n=1 Tax=Natronorubrum halalkaliphilum TaxID=2691917 RepID=A0A6B0VSN6_9EURY|nr:HalOD1 output domain-containing protein [Natronorubrum halalkaliphilum]MXV64143.1 hypothetical protein [Natronorubrum halalkaliphilum]
MGSKNALPRDLESDGEPDTLEYEYDGETPASIAVIHAICALTDVDPIDAPTELGFVLHEHVDPDAIDALLADGTGNGETVVSFAVDADNTYTVEIDDDGCIEVQYRS